MLYPLAAILGACVGSFLNVVIHRLPRDLSLLHPPSACPQCEHRIPFWFNMPVLSWLLLRGRCRWCQSPISARYLLIEALAAILAVAVLWRFGPTWQALSLFTLLAALLAVALIDWEFMIIPDQISLGFLALGLVLAPLTGPGIWRALLGAVGAGGLLLAVGVIWEKSRGVPAMGGGDVKLMAAVGAFLGLVPTLLVIFFGAFLGAIYGLVVLRRGGQTKVAFGTFLSLAALVVTFFGQDLITWYLHASGLGS
jgi:leader peptidase (prepilin peptidase)/N-methyltransferase